MYSANVIALGRAALMGSETEQRITVLLYDDNYQVISSFELNQIASLTYHEGSMVGAMDFTEKIIDLLLTIVSKPIDYSPLTIEKALVVTKQILIFGCTKIIHPIRVTLGRFIEALQTYNTALLAQQQTGATGIFMRLKGGSVDKGGPVRELAITVTRYIQNDSVLQFERNTQADPNSLVPVGERTKVSYVSDDARLRYLKRKMEHHKMMEQRSNLAKANDGFGAGYMSRDGKSVVGAAHGIDEMIRQAQRSKNQFTDDGSRIQQHDDIDVDELRQYAQEFEQQYGYTGSHQQTKPQQQQHHVPDLLSLDDLPSSSSSVPTSYQHSQQQTDLLLDFGPPQSTTISSNAGASSLLDADFYNNIPTSSGIDTVQGPLGTVAISSLSNAGGVSDPFMPALPATASEHQQQSTTIKKSVMGGGEVSSSFGGSSDDPFAVLDGNSLSSASLSSALNNNTSLVSGGLMSSFAGLGLGVANGSVNSANDSFAGVGGLGSMGANLSNTINVNTTNLGTKYGGGGSSSSTLPSSQSLSDAFSGLGVGIGGSVSNSSMMAANTVSMMSSNSGYSTGYIGQQVTTTAASAPLNLSSIQVSSIGYMASDVAVDDDDIASGFVMGGTTGAGLMPLGPAPGAPPPPPPPEW